MEKGGHDMGFRGQDVERVEGVITMEVRGERGVKIVP